MNPHSADRITNPSLLLRLRNAGDRQAWETFVEVYGPLIFSYCRQRRLQDSDAADVSQEVLTSLSRSLLNFEYQPDRGRFRDWLGKVTHRELLRFWRRKQRKPEYGLQDYDVASEAQQASDWDQHFHTELLQLALNRIRPEFEQATWNVFEDLWLNNMPASEVAKKYQSSIGSVYVIKSRALKRLRSEVLMLSDDLPWLREKDSVEQQPNPDTEMHETN